MSGFDPDKFLQETAPGPKPFDPDAFLAATAPKGPQKVPSLSAPASPGELKFSFKPGPAFKEGSSIPTIHGATPSLDPNDSYFPLPSAKVESPYDAEGKASPVSAGSAIAGGLSQGASADFGDELQGVVHAIAPGGPVEDRSKETPETPPTWKEALVAKYAKGRDAGRRENAAGADQHPGYYGTSHLIGNVGLAAANPVGGAAGGALVGGGMALGSNDADLTTEAGQKDALYSTAGGMLAGGALGATAENLPVFTGAAGGTAGLGLAAFGDKLGMSDAQRVEAGGAGFLGLLGAILAWTSGGAANRANARGAEARNALTDQIEARQAKAFEGMDREQALSKQAGLKKFEELSNAIEGKDPYANEVTAHVGRTGSPQKEVDPVKFISEHQKAIDVKEKPYERALQVAGRSKAKAFEEDVAAKQAARAQDDQQLVEALQNSARRQAAGAEGQAPDLSAQAQSKLGHEIKDFNADLRLMHGSNIEPPQESRSALEKYLAADVQARNKAYADKLEAAGGKEGRLQQILDELRAERAQGQSSANDAPSTVVEGRPRSIRAGKAVEVPPAEGLDKDRAAAMRALKIDYPTMPDDPRYPYYNEAQRPHIEAEKRAIDRILGIEPPELGAPKDYSAVVNGDERSALRDRLGLGRLVAGPPPSDAETLRNYADIQEWNRGVKTGPKTNIDRPVDDAEAFFTARPKSADRDPSFYSGPRPEEDYIDSPISGADWKKVSGAHVSGADLSHDQRMARLPFTEPTSGLDGPTPKQPEGGFPTQVEERVQQAIDKAPDQPQPGLAKQAAKALINRKLPLALVEKLMSGPADDAATAKLMSRQAELASRIPNFQEKYGKLLNNASGVQDFVNRLRFIEKQEGAQ